MPSRRQQLPATWATYEQGGRQDSQDSGLSQSQHHVTFDEESQERPDNSEDGQHHHSSGQDGQQEIRRRRSSLGVRVSALRNAGGVNSFDRFAASWQRAAGFVEVTPVRPSFRYADDEGDEHGKLVGRVN